MHKILLWSGFGMIQCLIVNHAAPLNGIKNVTTPGLTNLCLGVVVRIWQLGIEMRPFFNRQSLWVYPVYAGLGGSVGYWLMGVEQRQVAFLNERRDSLLEKRRRRAQREGVVLESEGGDEGEGLVDSVKKMVGSKEDEDSSQPRGVTVRKTGVELTPEEGRGPSVQ